MKKILKQIKNLISKIYKISNPTNFLIKKIFPWFKSSKIESCFQLLDTLLNILDVRNLTGQVLIEVKKLGLNLTSNYTNLYNSFVLFKNSEFYGIINIDNIDSKISYSFSSKNVLKPCKDLETVFEILENNFTLKHQKYNVIPEFQNSRDLELEELKQLLEF